MPNPHAVVVLADVVEGDRGKTHVLGAGWSTCAPGQRVLQTFVVLQMPWPKPGETSPISATVSLWKMDTYGDDGAKPVTSATVEGTLEAPPEAGPPPPMPVHQALLDLPLLATLKPETEYMIDVSIAGEATGWAPFLTGPMADDD